MGEAFSRPPSPTTGFAPICRCFRLVFTCSLTCICFCCRKELL
ncbi:hypothetical protein LINGRAHAP2_LOCUS7418 [Linum grandiflorum]